VTIASNVTAIKRMMDKFRSLLLFIV